MPWRFHDDPPLPGIEPLIWPRRLFFSQILSSYLTEAATRSNLTGFQPFDQSLGGSRVGYLVAADDKAIYRAYPVVTHTHYM